MKKKLPIGISNFKELIEESYAYIDKTLLIQEIVEKGGKVSLITRMRRFGKTLNLSMLQYFFEKSKEGTSHLFTSLNIWKIEKYRAMQGQFPVIFLSLKDIKYNSWQNACTAICRLIAKEFTRHGYLLEGNTLTQAEKEDFQAILQKQESQPLVEQSLLLLSEWLHRYHNKRVILLIDEYDTPAHSAFLSGYYDLFIAFLRNWLSAGLKDNSSLEFGVLTGILRIAKESVFSGLNNVRTFSILNEAFQDKFGFLESEVQTLLQECDLKDKLYQLRIWYNGYRVGTSNGIYNPWSVLTCIAEQGILAPYWVNTSDNALLTELMTEGTDEIKSDLEELMKGGIIEKNIVDGIIFENLKKNPNMIWSLLAFSGYLTISEPAVYGLAIKLKIPNAEVKELYESMILNWFSQSITEKSYKHLLRSLIEGDIDTFSRIFQEFIITSFSMFDVTQELPERVYHAFVLGILTGLKGRYEVKSNRESGLGRYDVMLVPKDIKDLGIILEFKKIDRFEQIDLEGAVQSALQQIKDKKYESELLDRGVRRILCVGLAFKGKQVLIRASTLHPS